MGDWADDWVVAARGEAEADDQRGNRGSEQ